MILPNLNCGGIENVACSMSRMFSGNGLEVYFFLESFDRKKSFGYSGIIKVLPFRLFQPEVKLTVQKMKQIIHNARLLKRVKKKYDIDVSVSFHSYIHILNVLADCKDKKILTIHEVTSSNAQRLKYFNYHTFFYQYLYRMADRVITVSKYCKWDLYQHMKMNPKDIQVIYNAIDEKRLCKETCEDVHFDSDKIVVTIGRLEEDKRQWHILHAFKRVLSYYEEALLVIIGEGHLENYLRKITKSLNIEKNVLFMGFQKNIGAYLKRAKVLVLSSVAEAFPCVITEAFYLGVPVISGDCKGGVREMLSKEKITRSDDWQYVDGGIITPELTNRSIKRISREEIQMGDAIVELISNEQKREEISRRCKEMSFQYSEDIIQKKWSQVIREIVMD